MQVDGFYPMVSLMAFLSGGCFGLYAGIRAYAEHRGDRTKGVDGGATVSDATIPGDGRDVYGATFIGM